LPTRERAIVEISMPTSNSPASVFLPFILLTLAIVSPVQAGTISTLSYNVAGLPVWANDQDPDTDIPIIAGKLDSNEWDVIAFQEAFDAPYYGSLAQGATTGGFSHISPKSGSPDPVPPPSFPPPPLN
jgi:hypothetical protein